jgi:signal transduction histidine kinase
MVGRWTLMRRFVAISLASIVPATLLFGWLTGAYLTHALLAREKSVTVEHVERLAFRGITAEQWRTLTTPPSQAALAAVARSLLDVPEVVRVKVFDAGGTIVWSDEPGTVGMNFADDEHVGASLGGRVVVQLERMRPPPPENVFEAKYERLTVIYVPVTDPGTRAVRGVIELYKLPDLFLETIRQGQLALWLIAAATGTLLWLTQLGLVWGAGKTVARQRVELEAHAHALEAANADLLAAQRQLVRAERLAALGEVTVAVAHGLRSPLANVRAVAQEALEAVPAGDPCAEPLRDIVMEVDRLEARLRALLRSTGPFELHVTPQKPQAVVDDVLASLGHSLEVAGACVEQAIDASLPEAWWDRPKIEQALQEVLVNSLEAGAHRILVCGRAEPGTAMIALEVEDDGAGLDPAANAQAFEPFFTTKPRGTGVGLAAVRRIVEAHGGEASIAPGDAGGTRVTLRLPFAPPTS